MKTVTNYIRIAVAAVSLSCSGAPAFANFSMSPSGSTTLFAVDAANQGTSLCAAASTECGATVPINTAGAPMFTAAVPGVVSQATAASLNATVVGTGTFATQSTLAAETTKVIGTVRNIGNAGGTLDAAVAATYPANALAVGVLNGANIGRLVGDETSGLWVNVKSATGVPQGTAIGTITGSLVMCQNTTSAALGYTTATINPMNCNTAGAMRTDGSAVTQPVSIASAQIASGAVASGAYASGSIASGAMAAGSMVDLLTMRGTVAAGTAAANSILAGAVFTSTAPTLTTGQQAALQVSARGGLLLGGDYPAGATPVTASPTNGSTGSVTATLGTGASVTTYICGFSIRANATVALTNNAQVTGTITGSLNFVQWNAPLASGLGVTEMIFRPCVPASGVNTSIAVVTGAPGAGGTVSASAWGYTL